MKITTAVVSLLLLCPIVFGGELIVGPVAQSVGLAEYLQTYGGWAVATICMSALVRLYTKTSDLLEKRNAQFIEILKETSKALEATTKAQERSTVVLERTEKLLTAVHQAMRTCQKKAGIEPENENG